MLKKPNKLFFEKFDTPIAFILGIYPTSNLGAVRNLGRHGVPTMVLDCKKNQAAFFSKYTQGFVCPHPKYNEKNYIDFLKQIGEQLPMKGVLIPTGDTETLAILKHQTSLEQYYHFTSAEYPVVNSLINKQQFYRLLETNNIPHAKTFFPTDQKDATTASTKLKYPCIVKPVYPTYFRLDFHTKLFIASSSDELLSYYSKALEKNHEMMLQEIIPGAAHTECGYNAYYDQTGAPHGIFMYQRIREWPLGFGNGCYIQQVQEPLLEQITTPLMKKIGYYGIVDAEFKRDPRDGIFKFIELNPRVWMQNSFPSRYGCNLPYIAYLDAIGKPIDTQILCIPHKKINWVYFQQDLQSSRAAIQTGTLSLYAWLGAYNLRNDHAVFAWDDPLPFFMLASQSISTLFSNLLRGTEE